VASRLDPWLPNLDGRGGPSYIAIADAIEADVRSGRLTPADRLPPQRALADRLDLNFTTVARGYVEAQRRGLIESRVGQGTFVRAAPVRVASRRPDLVDFTMNLPPEPDDPALVERMRDGFAAIAQDLTHILRYQGFGGAPEHKAAGLDWLSRRGLNVTAEQLLVCPGTHCVISTLFRTLAAPGETVLAEELTYPGTRALAARAGLKLVGVPLDEQGLEPAALEEACRRHRPKALYVNPTLLNPTTTTISLKRREAIIEIARAHRLAIIEDDAYGLLLPDGPPAFATLAPEITYYFTGMSKCVGAGLRIAYLATPDARSVWPVAAALRAETVMASPLTAHLATTWIENGTAAALLAFTRNESAARQKLAAAILPRNSYLADPGGFHLWVALPAPWKRSSFAAHMRQSGLGIVVSDAFSVSGQAPEAARVCLGGVANRAEVKSALEFMAHAMVEIPTDVMTVI
jgi:DNA-binding transcriptional MocR family regulator